MLNNYSCESPQEISSVLWKSGENFHLEELINPMLVGYNFTENFTVDAAEGIFRICLPITIKSNQFVGKKYRPSDFLKKQRE